MQYHRSNVIGNVGALQRIVIEHREINTGFDDDRGGNLLHLILYLPESGQSNHKYNGGVLQGLNTKLLGMPREDEVLQTVWEM